MNEQITAIGEAISIRDDLKLQQNVVDIFPTEDQSEVTRPERDDLQTAFYNLESHTSPAALRFNTQTEKAILLYLAPDQLYKQRPQRRLAFWKTSGNASPEELQYWQAQETMLRFKSKKNPVRQLVDQAMGPMFFHQQPDIENKYLNPHDEWYLLPHDVAVHIQIQQLAAPIEDLNGEWHEEIVPATEIPTGVRPTPIDTFHRMDDIFEEVGLWHRGALYRRIGHSTNYTRFYRSASPALVEMSTFREPPGYERGTKRLS